MAPSAAATEFGAALSALGITQRHAAQLFAVTPRHIRRWESGGRRVPHAVGIVCNLLTMGAVTVEQAEAAAPVSARTSSGAKGEPPAPKQSASARAEVGAFAGLSPAAAAVVALDAKSCHWPRGDPQHVGFGYCCDPVVKPPYCERHRKQAYLAPRTGSGHGVRIGFVARGRPSIPGAFSATGASRPPLGKATQVPTSPNTGTRSIQHRVAQAQPPA
jgi:hypothetical protein